jgi:NAD(P)-dependent dehydrogenase (short-subunit alcohol dehydrogenase family)
MRTKGQTTMLSCIAGGTSGIGAAVSHRLLAAGGEVVAVGRGEAHADEFRASISSKDADRVTVLAGDLAEEAFAADVAKAVTARGPALHLLVNGAGTISGGGIRHETFDVWQRVMRTNLDAPFNLTKACIDLLAAGAPASSVVNVSSVCSLRPCSSLSYSVSKAGVDMFTKSLARELAPMRIRVNAVNPSVVRTNLQKSAGLFDDDSAYGKWVSDMEPSHPLGRIGEPEEIAEAILYFADPRVSGWTTGAVLSIDGGRGIA